MSSILATDGWNWEDAVIRADDGVHVNFPKQFNVMVGGQNQSQVIKTINTRNK
jgi:hypothetical protein